MDNQVQIARYRFLQDKSPENELAYIVALQRADIKHCKELTTIYCVEGNLTAENPSFEIPNLHPYLKDHKFRTIYDTHITSSSEAYAEVNLVVGNKLLWDSFYEPGTSHKLSITNLMDPGKEPIRFSLKTGEEKAHVKVLMVISEGPRL